MRYEATKRVGHIAGRARRAVAALLLTTLATAAACSTSVNPSLAITHHDASLALDEMRAAPQPLERPLVVIGGYLDPGFAPGQVTRTLRPTVHGGPVITVTCATARCFDECRDRVLAAVLEAMPARTEVAPGRFETVEVDVIGNSMGGLVARYAAMWPEPSDVGECSDDGEVSEVRDDSATGETSHPESHYPDTRLRIARLFTLSTPHRGAVRAKPTSASRLERDMVPGSDFLAVLDAALVEANCHTKRETMGETSGEAKREAKREADYELVCYVRLGDSIVGAENASPTGSAAYWVNTPPLEAAHLFASYDPRILADIARRLRGETPLATSTPAPLPE